MLRDFYNNVELRKAVHTFIIEQLRIKAVEKVFNREDTSAVAEAKEMVDHAFDEMETMFVSKKKVASDEAV